MAKTNSPAGAKAAARPASRSRTARRPKALGRRAEGRPSAKAAAKRPSKGPGPGKPKRPSVEIGGPKGLNPTRYGDWERKGRCIDF